MKEGSAILVYGSSGFGKSSGIRNLPSEKTAIICSDEKPLPIWAWKTHYKKVKGQDGKIDWSKTNYVETKSANSVIKAIDQWILQPHIEFIVLDTITHIMVGKFMETAFQTGYTKFTQIAHDIYTIINKARSCGKNMIVIGHSDEYIDSSGVKKDKVRTIGKLVDEKVDIPSLFTTVLTPSVSRDRDKPTASLYEFITQSDGTNYAKSPVGFYMEGNVQMQVNALPYRMPNDYKLVFDYLDAFAEGKIIDKTLVNPVVKEEKESSSAISEKKEEKSSTNDDF